jgi:tetratricopeptide (TPR) repeat protein
MLKTKRNLSWLHLLLLLGMTIAIVGCEKDTVVEVIPLDPVELAREGWFRFEVGNYSEALVYFNLAIKEGAVSADPFNGAGWSAYRYHKLDGDTQDYIALAKTKWIAGLAKPRGSKDAIEVGLAHHAMWVEDEIADAIDLFEGVLERNSNFAFDHYQLLDYRSIYAELAYGYFFTGVIAIDDSLTNDALDYVMLLDSDYVYNGNVNDLLEKIELIRNNMQPIR